MRKFTPVFRSPWFWAIAGGYILRVILMPVTGQHDVMFMSWMTRFINQGHFNLYSFLHQQFGEVVMQSPGVWAPYPYGFYLFNAGWLEILERVGLVDLETWDSVWQVMKPARLVFLFKLIYLPFDLGIGYILYRLSGRLGLALWAWSPTAFYTPFMMGQNDIYATALAVAGVYTAAQALQSNTATPSRSSWRPGNKSILAAILLGLGSTFKLFPLFLLPPVVLIIEKKAWPRLVLLALGSGILGLASLPFLTTPAYVNGVLLNPEGSQIFREVTLFSVNVSPFLLSYLLLLGYLFAADYDRAWSTPWLASLLVIALLFLWVPTWFYWLIWLTPFLIALLKRAEKLLWAWLALQAAFALGLLSEHRELGVALPIHLSDTFNMPNLPTALAVTQPTLYRLFLTTQPLVNALLVVALLLAAWYSGKALLSSRRSIPVQPDLRWWIGLPALILFLGLSVNLLFGSDLVSRNNWYQWQQQTITDGQHVLQELSIEQDELSGIRLRITEMSPTTSLQACLYQSLTEQEPLACTSREATQQVENQILYFVFDETIPLNSGDKAAVRVEAHGEGASVTLPYATAAVAKLHRSGTLSDGTLDISSLSPFDTREAFNDLVVKNILQDTFLALTIVGVIFLVIILLGGWLHVGEEDGFVAPSPASSTSTL